MKRATYTIIWVFALMQASCFSNQDEFIGSKKISGSSHLFVNIYQKDVFDYVTPVSFEIVDRSGKVILPMKYLTGTDKKLENVSKFEAAIHDSIFYLCYPYPKVHYIHNFNPEKVLLKHNELFREISKHDPKLVDKRAFY